MNVRFNSVVDMPSNGWVTAPVVDMPSNGWVTAPVVGWGVFYDGSATGRAIQVMPRGFPLTRTSVLVVKGSWGDRWPALTSPKDKVSPVQWKGGEIVSSYQSLKVKGENVFTFKLPPFKCFAGITILSKTMW